MDAHLTAYPPQSCPKDRNFRFADHTLSTSQKGVMDSFRTANNSSGVGQSGF